MRITLLLLSLSLYCTSALCMEGHRFHVEFSGAEGLYGPNVASCCEDKYGRLWLATSEGVYFYTGSRFSKFSNQDYVASCSKMTYRVAADSNGFIWIITKRGFGYYDPDTDSFHAVGDETANRRSRMVFDASGNVWLGLDSRLMMYERKSGALRTVLTAMSNITNLCLRDDDLLFTDADGGIYRYPVSTGDTEPVRTAYSENGRTVRYEGLALIDSGSLLTSTSDGRIMILDLVTGEEEVIIDCSGEDITPHVLTMMTDGCEYWIGTQIGAFIHNAENGSTEWQIYGKGGSLSLANHYVRDLFRDSNGNIWASTLTGLKGCMNYSGNFREYTYSSEGNSPSGISVCAVAEGPDGRMWFGSDEGKVFCLNPEDGLFTDYSELVRIPESSAIDDLEFRDELLCIISYGYGLSVFDTAAEKLVHRIPSFTFKNITPLPGDGFRAYIGCVDGLYYLKDLYSPPVKIEAVTGAMVSDISEIVDGKCWIGTYGKGFGTIDIDTNTYVSYNTGENGSFVKNDFITSIRCCRDGSVWIATDGEGIGKLSVNGGAVTDIEYFGAAQGLPYDNVRAICFHDNDIWVSTPNGLCRISRLSMEATGIYMQADKVVGPLFNDRTGCQASDGTMYFGTSKGIIAFNPENFARTFAGKKVLINDITVGDLNNRHSKSEHRKSAIASKTVTIRQKNAPIVSFSFSTMTYGNPHLVRYKCILKGRSFVNETVTTDNSVNYLGLRSGRYSFTVEVNDGEGNVVSDSKTIRIMAPWYRCKAAACLYLSLLIACLVAGIMALLSWKKKRMEIEADIKEDIREKKIQQEKIDFMTNITHEIRTPISVISILVDKIFGKGDVLPPDALALKQNVTRIIGLCNELLDLRKIQESGFAVILKTEDLRAITESVIAPYREVAVEKRISFEVKIPGSPVYIGCDKDSMVIVLNNLLSNAVKYCASRIRITLSADSGKAVLRVDSDGKRIPDYDRERIFDAFYQSKAIDSSGTGLGLSFSKSLVQKNGGKLFLDGSMADMNSFVAEFLLAESAPQTGGDVRSPANDESGMNENEALSGGTILIVEDNETLRNLIAEQLSESGDVISACNGKEALELMKENDVEIVISDIMMPEMDGCELCNIIKTSTEFSHTSVILLTAAVGIESHMKSLRAGADCYLEKPLNMDILKTAIGNIAVNRKIHNRMFSVHPFGRIECSVSGATEQALMDRLHDTMNEHIGNPELTTSDLADLMKLPRKVLSRKLRVNTGLSVNEYIRVCRLKKAAELLAENRYLIKEVAYYVGYSSSSYFAKHFTSQFGVSPSKFVSQYSGKGRLSGTEKRP